MPNTRQKPSRALLVLSAVVIVLVAAGLIETQTKVLRRLYDDVVLDSRNHYLTCRELPAYTEAKRVVEAHRDVFNQIEEAGGDFRIEGYTCLGETEVRADILIWYPSHQNRVAIEGIINGETLFGIPYRLLNN